MKSKTSILLTSAAVLAAGSDAASSQDWNGAYAGLSYGATSGTSPSQPYVYDEGYQLDGSAVGAFAGLRWQLNDQIVVGGELALSGPIDVSPPASETGNGDGYSFNNLTDLKLTVGTPVGKALVYGFTGVSAGTLEADGESYSATGMNFGLGVDYKINQKFSVGMEYIARNMSGYSSGGNPDDLKGANTLSLRASFNF